LSFCFGFVFSTSGAASPAALTTCHALSQLPESQFSQHREENRVEDHGTFACAGWPFSINQGPKSADVNKCGGKLVVATVSTTVTITAITTTMKTNWRGN